MQLVLRKIWFLLIAAALALGAWALGRQGGELSPATSPEQLVARPQASGLLVPLDASTSVGTRASVPNTPGSEGQAEVRTGVDGGSPFEGAAGAKPLPTVFIDSELNRSTFAHIVLKNDLANLDAKFRGQMMKDLISEIPPGMQAANRAAAETQARLLDELWLAYEFESVTSAIDHTLRGGDLHMTGQAKGGRSVSASYVVGPQSGFSQVARLEVSYLLTFETYPRMKDLLQAFYDEKAVWKRMIEAR